MSHLLTATPEEMNRLLIVAPVAASYADGVVARLRDKQFPSGQRDVSRDTQSEEMKELLIVAPVVASYLPIVSLPPSRQKFERLHFRVWPTARRTQPRQEKNGVMFMTPPCKIERAGIEHERGFRDGRTWIVRRR